MGNTSNFGSTSKPRYKTGQGKTAKLPNLTAWFIPSIDQTSPTEEIGELATIKWTCGALCGSKKLQRVEKIKMMSKSDERTSTINWKQVWKQYFVRIFLQEKRVLEIVYCMVDNWSHFLVLIVGEYQRY